MIWDRATGRYLPEISKLLDIKVPARWFVRTTPEIDQALHQKLGESRARRILENGASSESITRGRAAKIEKLTGIAPKIYGLPAEQRAHPRPWIGAGKGFTTEAAASIASVMAWHQVPIHEIQIVADKVAAGISISTMRSWERAAVDRR